MIPICRHVIPTQTTCPLQASPGSSRGSCLSFEPLSLFSLWFFIQAFLLVLFLVVVVAFVAFVAFLVVVAGAAVAADGDDLDLAKSS